MKTVVFSDIDGTLLNSHHKITPRTRWAIEQLTARDIPFVVVTARGITGTYPVLEQNGIVCPVITYSGGVILDEQRRVIDHHGLTKAQAQAVVDFADAEGLDMIWNAYSFEDWVVPDKSDARVRNEEAIVMAEAREGTIASIERDEVQKLLCICDPAQTKAIERKLKERFPDLSIMLSSDILIEIMQTGTTKAGAVRRLCELWDVDPAHALAFGDNYNDVPMLEAVGSGYLMANAPQELLDRMPLHTASNDEDGIAVVLERLGLISAE